MRMELRRIEMIMLIAIMVIEYMSMMHWVS